jgi:hypothetical protein
MSISPSLTGLKYRDLLGYGGVPGLISLGRHPQRKTACPGQGKPCPIASFLPGYFLKH